MFELLELSHPSFGTFLVSEVMGVCFLINPERDLKPAFLSFFVQNSLFFSLLNLLLQNHVFLLGPFWRPAALEERYPLFDDLERLCAQESRDFVPDFLFLNNYRWREKMN